MRKTFIEFVEFTTWVKSYLTDDGLAAIQRELLANPARGDVIPGCGGLRKVRAANPLRNSGKQGGARVIYLHVAEADVIYLMDIYGKGEQEDLTASQKKTLKRLAEETSLAAIQLARSLKKGPS
jgi:hypothetical protein